MQLQGTVQKATPKMLTFKSREEQFVHLYSNREYICYYPFHVGIALVVMNACISGIMLTMVKVNTKLTIQLTFSKNFRFI